MTGNQEYALREALTIIQDAQSHVCSERPVNSTALNHLYSAANYVIRCLPTYRLSPEALRVAAYERAGEPDGCYYCGNSLHRSSCCPEVAS